jgi:thiol peroxidase
MLLQQQGDSMATITLKGNPIHTSGELPVKGKTAPNFTLVKGDLSEATLASFAGKRKVLNVFPSIDTGACAMSVRTFNKEAGALKNTTVLNISADLPFAQSRFCGAEGISTSVTLSSFRSSFARDYGLQITDGVLSGLCSRVVIVLDEQNTVLHAEQVAEIAHEPDYVAALAVLK